MISNRARKERFMTYNELFAALCAAGIGDDSECRREAALLAEHFGGIRASELPYRRNEDMESLALQSALERRINREPLQYILGEWEFFGLPFRVTPDCLIPRPDTELLVTTAMRLLPLKAHFADLGTGSGAVAVSILKNRPDVSATAADISPCALAVARENAKRHGTLERCTFICADMLSSDFFKRLPHPIDAVISNPPYIPTDELAPGKIQPELCFEPELALCGGKDGLDFYRQLIPRSAATGVLSEEGFVLFEVGAGEAQDVAQMGKNVGFFPQIFRDLGGIERAVLLSRKDHQN